MDKWVIKGRPKIKEEKETVSDDARGQSKLVSENPPAESSSMSSPAFFATLMECKDLDPDESKN